MKYRSAFFIVSALVLAAGTVFAEQPETPATNMAPGGHVLTIPANATKVSENVYSLGQARDPQTNAIAEGYLFVHKRGTIKPGGVTGGSRTGSTCYTYLASGAKWKILEPWVVNPTNTYGLSDLSVFSILDGGIAKWEDAADGNVNGIPGANIIGQGSTTSLPLLADETAPDGQNEVYFGQLDPGTIAVTIVWGIFSGPTRNRQLVEWDQVFNTHYPWSDTGAPDAMDFNNIATHELGHTVGMGDLYTSSCTEETMYGYGDLGETKKQTLNAGDITGINNLY